MMRVDEVKEYTPEMRELLRRSQYVTYLTYLTKFGVPKEYIYSLLDSDIQSVFNAEDGVCLTASDNDKLRGILISTLLQWDTTHFGFPCYKINYFFSDGKISTKEDVPIKKAMLKTFKEKIVQRDAKLITGRAVAGDWGSLWALESEGFNIVDTLVVLAKDIAKPLTIKGSLPFPTTVTRERPDLLPKLKGMLKEAFPTSRFIVDFHFPSGSGEQVYLKWLEEVCRKGTKKGETYIPVHSEEGHKGEREKLLIIEKDKGEVVGFITYKEQKTLGMASIELVVVNPAYQGIKAGDYLIGLVENDLQGGSISTLEVTAYLYNYPALNTYIRSSFKPVSSIYTLHKWL
jgi:ribosomal protein S18 acetylase RimI-like enzyme